MNIRMSHILLPAAAVLGLAACDNDAEVADANLSDTNGAAMTAGGSYAGTEASLDPNNLRTDVTLLLGSGNGTGGSGAAAGGAADGGQSADGNASAGGGTAGTGDSNASGAAGAGTGADGMAGDRDGDGRLSPAEYAALTMPSVDPTQKAPGSNDEMRPYVSDEALNEAITGFRRLDTNGDFYLSPDEYRTGS